MLDSSDIPISTLMLDAPGGSAAAYVARPVGDPRGAVLLFMDAFGLRPQIARMASRMASWGYGVIAPHVFYRWGSVDQLRPAGSLLDPRDRADFFTPAVLSRIDGYTTQFGDQDNPVWLRALNDEFGAVPIGTSGYCFGARLAVKLAGRYPGLVVAAGGWHGGGLVTDALDSPHNFIAEATAEFHFGHSDDDPGMTPDNVRVLGMSLDRAGVAHRNELFVGAAHGYTMQDTSAYSAEPAERHWKALEELLARAFVAHL